MRRRIILTLLLFFILCSLGAETYIYQTSLSGKPIGRVTVESFPRSPDGITLDIAAKGRVTVIFSIGYGVEALLECDSEGELLSGNTLVNGMGADIAMRFLREDGLWQVEKKTGNRRWTLQKEGPFCATTLFFFNPLLIENLRKEHREGGTVSLLDIENSRVTKLDFEFSRSPREPWGDVIVMSNKDMISYFDPISHRLLYSEVIIMGRKVTTVLQTVANS